MSFNKKTKKFLKYLLVLLIFSEFFCGVYLVYSIFLKEIQIKDFLPGGNTLAEPIEQAYKCTDCNIILISVDTLRQDRLGTYGYSKNLTPNIDFLAENGLVFYNAYTLDTWTVPSYATLFTSKDTSLHRVNNWDVALNDKEITLAEVLKQNGYNTFAFVEDEGLHPYFNFDQGFDEYYFGYPLEDKKLETILDNNKNKKIFLFLQLDDVHLWPTLMFESPDINRTKILNIYDNYISGFRLYNYNQISEQSLLYFWDYVSNKTSFEDININTSYTSFKEFYNALYDDSVFKVDIRIGDFVDLLRKKGFLDNSLIIITADHGEELNKHFAHTLCEEVVRIPLILVYLNKGLKKTLVYDYISNLDIFPTVIGLVEIKNKFLLQGKNFLAKDFESDCIMAPEYLVYKGIFVKKKDFYDDNKNRDLIKEFEKYHTIKTEKFKDRLYSAVKINYPKLILEHFRRYNPAYVIDNNFNIQDYGEFNTWLGDRFENRTKIYYKLKVKEISADKSEKEIDSTLLKNYFLPSYSPYPGMITNLIECQEGNSLQEIIFLNKTAYIYPLNSRFVPSCITEDIRYKALRFYIYSDNHLMTYEVAADPLIFKINSLEKYFSSLENNII